MGLDGLRRSTHAARLDHIGIERSLHKPLHFADFLFQPMRLFFEDPDEFVADDLALLLRLAHAGQFFKKPPARVHRDQVQAQFVAEVLLDFLKLVLAQHTVVDEDAYQPPADSAMHQHRRHRRIHASGKSANDPALFANGLVDLLDAFVDEMLRGPVAARAADIDHEIAQQIDAALGMVDLRMKLDGPYAAGL